MSSVIQALEDIAKAIAGQGGSGGGSSDSGDEEESFPETLVVRLLGDAEDGYSVDEDYRRIEQALVYDLRQVVVVDGSLDGEHYYYFNTSSDDFDGGTDEDGIEHTYEINYYEFRALPDGSGVDYVKIYHNDDTIEDQLQGFSEVVKGRYTFGS